jgi:hypothetical protein
MIKIVSYIAYNFKKWHCWKAEYSRYKRQPMFDYFSCKLNMNKRYFVLFIWEICTSNVSFCLYEKYVQALFRFVYMRMDWLALQFSICHISAGSRTICWDRHCLSNVTWPRQSGTRSFSECWSNFMWWKRW